QHAEPRTSILLRNQAGEPAGVGQGGDELLGVPALLVAFPPVRSGEPLTELTHRRADLLVLVDRLQRVHVVSSLVPVRSTQPPPIAAPGRRRLAISSSP